MHNDVGAGKTARFVDHLTAAATGAHRVHTRDAAIDQLAADYRYLFDLPKLSCAFAVAIATVSAHKVSP